MEVEDQTQTQEEQEERVWVSVKKCGNGLGYHLLFTVQTSLFPFLPPKPYTSPTTPPSALSLVSAHQSEQTLAYAVPIVECVDLLANDSPSKYAHLSFTRDLDLVMQIGGTFESEVAGKAQGRGLHAFLALLDQGVEFSKMCWTAGAKLSE